MSLTLDTNLFVYAVDARDAVKQKAALVLIEGLRAAGGPIGLQICGEFYSVISRKLKQPPWIAAQAARNLITAFPSFAATTASTERALAEAATGRFPFWDANLLSAAEMAGCTVLLSEDMHDGARLGGIEVIRAFAPDGPSERALAAIKSITEKTVR